MTKPKHTKAHTMAIKRSRGAIMRAGTPIIFLSSDASLVSLVDVVRFCAVFNVMCYALAAIRALTSCLKTSPRSSKPLNSSKDEQAGERSTVSPGRAAAIPASSACSR